MEGKRGPTVEGPLNYKETSGKEKGVQPSDTEGLEKREAVSRPYLPRVNKHHQIKKGHEPKSPGTKHGEISKRRPALFKEFYKWTLINGRMRGEIGS